ncbi:MAG: polysaccharide pyruvyl transferase family protein [Mediterraneibacter gnavus]
MKKIATITFHHAHNFGSALQAYALQQFVLSLYKDSDVEYKIIDYYTELQEELYSVYKHDLSIKSIIKNFVAFLYSKQLKNKHQKFEDFLKNRCMLTRRYKNKQELIEDIPIADVYISGSDQLWNVRAEDFDSVYYYDFLADGCKRISYAASLGPLQIDWGKYDYKKYKDLISKYKSISVREKGSYNNLEKITDIKCNINVDPTLLISKEEWQKIESKEIYNDGKYILLYCLEPSKEQLKIADEISKKLQLPIVILRYNNKNDMFNHFVKKYAAGPEDFLAYIDHAALVLSSSFHGTAFSLIYHKPFYVLNGINDNRISEILNKTNMTERSLESIEDIKNVNLNKPDEKMIDLFLENERVRSELYLKEAIGK